MKDWHGKYLICTKCGKKKPAEAFARDDDRRHSSCRDCNYKQTPRATLLRENRRLEAKGQKRCVACGEIKGIDIFPLFPSGRRSGACRPCRLEERKQQRVAKGGMTKEQRHAIVEQKARIRAEKKAERKRSIELMNCYMHEYYAWQSMIQRCTRATHPKFNLYGGRGIMVCDRWRHSFLNFFKDIGPRPHVGLSIDRINNDGNYEPGNVRWADATTQARNKRQRKKRGSHP